MNFSFCFCIAIEMHLIEMKYCKSHSYPFFLSSQASAVSRSDLTREKDSAEVQTARLFSCKDKHQYHTCETKIVGINVLLIHLKQIHICALIAAL